MKTKFKKDMVLFYLLSVGFLACQNEEITTGLEGVTFKGPINPLAMEGEINDAPFSALFHVYDLSNMLVKSFNSNEQGKFMVLLASGNYKIIPDESAPVLRPELQMIEVIVQEVELTQQDLYFDTGIR